MRHTISSFPYSSDLDFGSHVASRISPTLRGSCGLSRFLWKPAIAAGAGRDLPEPWAGAWPGLRGLLRAGEAATFQRPQR